MNVSLNEGINMVNNKRQIQDFTIANPKTIKIKLLTGKYALKTTDNNQISIDYKTFKKNEVEIVIHDKENFLLLKQNKGAPLLQLLSKNYITISIPENYDLEYSQNFGKIRFSGFFNSIKTKIRFGVTIVDLFNFKLNKNSVFKVIIGRIRFKNYRKMMIKMLEFKEFKATFSIADNITIVSSTTIGDIKIERVS